MGVGGVGKMLAIIACHTTWKNVEEEWWMKLSDTKQILKEAGVATEVDFRVGEVGA
jgi:hypothetical protein